VGTAQRRYYWTRYTDGDGSWRKRDDAPPGAELAALRRGAGREPGSVPQMWPFYTHLTADGRMSSVLRAEHVALTLYALHQQSRTQPMHREQVGVGTAMLALRRSDRFSADAVDRRFAAAATATSLTEVAVHLRGLVTQLRVIGQSLDYSRLVQDLRGWQDPERRGDVRRRWGSQYFARPNDTATEKGEAPTVVGG
jgi:CRISPR system Cascade subunit CasB